MSSLKAPIFAISMFTMFLAACSLYQSEGRKCIEEGCAPFFTAASLGATNFDHCYKTSHSNSPLKKNLKTYPLSEVEHEVGLRAYHKNIDQKPWLKVHYQTPLQDQVQVCEFRFHSQKDFADLADQAVDLSFEYMQNTSLN